MPNETIVRLKVKSEIHTPNLIANKLGLESDNSWRKGESIPNTTMVRTDNGFIIDSGLPKSESLENHIEILLRRLSSKKAALLELSRNDTVEISCVLYCSTPPALNFPKEWIKDLSEFGACLDIDLYITEQDS